jgi:hypothetical protein
LVHLPYPIYIWNLICVLASYIDMSGISIHPHGIKNRWYQSNTDSNHLSRWVTGVSPAPQEFGYFKKWQENTILISNWHTDTDKLLKSKWKRRNTSRDICQQKTTSTPESCAKKMNTPEQRRNACWRGVREA